MLDQYKVAFRQGVSVGACLHNGATWTRRVQVT